MPRFLKKPGALQFSIAKTRLLIRQNKAGKRFVYRGLNQNNSWIFLSLNPATCTNPAQFWPRSRNPTKNFANPEFHNTIAILIILIDIALNYHSILKSSYFYFGQTHTFGRESGK